MEIKHLRCLALEIFKTVNNLNPYYMKEIFSKATSLTHRPLDVSFNQSDPTKDDSNALGGLEAHIWNGTVCLGKSKRSPTFGMKLFA